MRARCRVGVEPHDLAQRRRLLARLQQLHLLDRSVELEDAARDPRQVLALRRQHRQPRCRVGAVGTPAGQERQRPVGGIAELPSREHALERGGLRRRIGHQVVVLVRRVRLRLGHRISSGDADLGECLRVGLRAAAEHGDLMIRIRVGAGDLRGPEAPGLLECLCPLRRDAEHRRRGGEERRVVVRACRVVARGHVVE